MQLPWEMIFTVTNSGVLLFWLLLAFGPRTVVTRKIIFFAGVCLLAATYAVLIVMLLGGFVDDGGSGGSPDFTTLAGIQALFAAKGGATIGWIHYLAFDLFVGMWIASNADRHGFSRIVQVPFLFFTLMTGPLGLTLYVLVRKLSGRTVSGAVTPH
jgi:hypothetical protein